MFPRARDPGGSAGNLRPPAKDKVNSSSALSAFSAVKKGALGREELAVGRDVAPGRVAYAAPSPAPKRMPVRSRSTQTTTAAKRQTATAVTASAVA